MPIWISFLRKTNTFLQPHLSFWLLTRLSFSFETNSTYLPLQWRNQASTRHCWSMLWNPEQPTWLTSPRRKSRWIYDPCNTKYLAKPVDEVDEHLREPFFNKIIQWMFSLVFSLFVHDSLCFYIEFHVNEYKLPEPNYWAKSLWWQPFRNICFQLNETFSAVNCPILAKTVNLRRRQKLGISCSTLLVSSL